ncbi:hypothetical protein VTK73DRAFT_726 [Phialemonium thermophilum]|uniref:Mediator of RNA polymerase II transcription subunit 1 n=1 Tax=Phialemonium thermophilum TaxID=223376 RepID=A0ABR3XD13_9PEZI
MSTPTPKHQGKTPSQSQNATSPPVSTPFSASATQTAFSPLGARSSPQHVKKSPATSAAGPSHHANNMVGFDSPSAAAAFGALGLGDGLNLGLDGVSVGALAGLGSVGKLNEDERARRLDQVIEILNKHKGVVSEAGLERLAKKLGLECLWEDDMGSEPKSRTLIVAGSALELLIVFSNNVVQSVSLAFPDSSESVTKHAEKAGKILLDDLKLLPGQSPLTKRLNKFAANFEYLATLDKLSIMPGLNLYEAVAGIYDSLTRLYQWDLRKVREDPAFTGKNDQYLTNVVLCTRHGMPRMHARDRVGLSLDYWKEKHLIPPPEEGPLAVHVVDEERTWGFLIGCAPMGRLATPPVRVSDRWISADVEKVDMNNELPHIGPGVALDWLEPENTLIQVQDPAKPEGGAHTLPGDTSMLGPKLPEVTFSATLDPPLNIPLLLWQQIRQVGGDLTEPGLVYVTLDSLAFPLPPGSHRDPTELRTIRSRRQVNVLVPGSREHVVQRTHKNTLYIYKPVYGMTLKDIRFSHPQQLVAMLPFLRQFAFLWTVLGNSFGQAATAPATEKAQSPGTEPTTASISTTTTRDEFSKFMNEATKSGASVATGDAPLAIDVTLTVQPVPRLQIVFPFRSSTADVVLQIQVNGQVHVESQNILDDTNSEGANGRRRRPEDIGKLLETIEDIDKWAEFIRTRWS